MDIGNSCGNRLFMDCDRKLEGCCFIGNNPSVSFPDTTYWFPVWGCGINAFTSKYIQLHVILPVLLDCGTLMAVGWGISAAYVKIKRILNSKGCSKKEER